MGSQDEKSTDIGASHKEVDKQEFSKGPGDAVQTVTRIMDKSTGEVRDIREDKGRIVEHKQVKPVSD
jgi:hypothetical protein